MPVRKDWRHRGDSLLDVGAPAFGRVVHDENGDAVGSGYLLLPALIAPSLPSAFGFSTHSGMPKSEGEKEYSAVHQLSRILPESPTETP